jgi:hypothetical protein
MGRSATAKNPQWSRRRHFCAPTRAEVRVNLPANSELSKSAPRDYRKNLSGSPAQRCRAASLRAPKARNLVRHLGKNAKTRATLHPSRGESLDQAERGRFELPIRKTAFWFSKPAHSAALAPLRWEKDPLPEDLAGQPTPPHYGGTGVAPVRSTLISRHRRPAVVTGSWRMRLPRGRTSGDESCFGTSRGGAASSSVARLMCLVLRLVRCG